MRTARSAQRGDQEPAQRVAPYVAPRPQLKLVWSADGSDAPAALEPGAAPYLVAFHRGYMCGTGGLVEQALGLFREAVALKPDFAEAHYGLGWALDEARQFPEAIAACREALALKPDFAEAHYNLGHALAATGQFAEAIAAYREALALKPDFAEAHNNLGLALTETGEFAEAIAACREAVALKPDFAEAHYNLGWALDATGQFAEAIAACREALALKPDFAEAHYNLGNALAATGQFAEAIAAYREAVALKPDYAAAHYNLGAALAATEQFAEAIAAYREARKVEPDINERRKIALLIKECVNKQKYFIESNNPPRYTSKHEEYMGDKAAIIQAAAELLSRVYPAERVGKALEDLEAAEAARENTDRAPAEQHPTTDSIAEKLSLLEKEATARGDSTLFGLLRRYAEMRESIELPARGLTLEQARAAAGLSSTYANLQARLTESGLKALPRDPLVTEARRLSSAFYRSERVKKPTAPRRPKKSPSPRRSQRAAAIPT